MKRSLAIPAGGWAAAVAVTSTMDATGASMLSALPLFPLSALFAYLQRLSLKDLGIRWGGARALPWYGFAVLYPVVVTAIIAGVAALTGALDPATAPHHRHSLWFTLPLNIILGIPVGLLTEEGFFRGWLWASLKRAGQKPTAVILLTSVAFALWHWSAVLLPTGFNPPMAQVPTFMVNAALLGAIWGMVRLLSGSLLASSISHGVWNGLVYAFFGFGQEIGTLGIRSTELYGPEIGVLGLVLNLSAALGLWYWCRRAGVFERPPEG